MNDILSNKGDAVEVDMESLLTFTQKTVLLLGQAINTTSYQRGFNALSILMSTAEAKNSGKKEIWQPC